MRFGINTLLFASPFTNAQTRWFRQFARWGFDAVEVAVEDPALLDPAHVKRELDRNGLACAAVCAILPPDRDLRGTAAQQRSGLSYLKTCVDYAVALDAPSVIGPVYSCVGRADAVPPSAQRQQWATVVRHLKTLTRYAEPRGRRFCLEPLNRFETDFINTCEQGLKMIAAVDSPALKLHLDTFHMNIEEKFPAEAIRRAGRHLAHLHACGSDRGTPGGDHTDWKAIARALKDIGYSGDVVIEAFSTKIEVIARAAAIWRRIEPSESDIATKGLAFLKRALR
jgi:D-psicose/D-tagatose/L-ribulose 3-epimerase